MLIDMQESPVPVPLLVRVTLGWTTIDEATLVEHQAGPGVRRSYASVEIPNQEMWTTGIEYRGEATVDSRDSSPQRLFTGLVDRVEPGDSTTRIRLAGFDTELAENAIGGLAVGEGSNALEVVYCLLRLAGFPEEQLDIEGYRPGPRETFIVSVPVHGATVVRDREICEVTFTANDPARVNLPSSDVVEQYDAADHWAYTTVMESTILAAERSGLSKIDYALSVATTTFNYGYPELDGKLVSYRRDATRVSLSRGPVVFVGSVTTGRRWLRAPSDIALRPRMSLEELLPDWIDGFHSNETIRLPLNEWRLAAGTDDRLARVTHLWRCIELYAAGTKTYRLFERTELDLIRKALRRDWKPDQKERLHELIGNLNTDPLMVRLKMALKRDGIELTPDELDLLRRTRDLRNDLEHGRIVSADADIRLDRDIARALSLMNRILVAGVAKLARGRRNRKKR